MEHTEWIFTFGCGQYPFAGKCVRIKGTWKEARQKMFDLVGTHWGFQYSAEQWEHDKTNPNRGWSMETEIPLEEVEEYIRNGGKVGEV